MLTAALGFAGEEYLRKTCWRMSKKKTQQNAILSVLRGLSFIHIRKKSMFILLNIIFVIVYYYRYYSL